MDLFGDSQTLAPHERVDGAITNKDLNKTIQSKGGIGKVYQESTDALSEALFDVESRTLYEATGGTPGKRNTLPKEAQKAFIAGEIRADHDLRGKEIQGGAQQRNEQIVDSVRESGKQTRRWLPW